MYSQKIRRIRALSAVTLFLTSVSAALADDWIRLFDAPPSDSWLVAADAALDPSNPRTLVPSTGDRDELGDHSSVLISSKNGPKRDRNLTSKQLFGDVELSLEFMLAKRSNAGVKLHGVYEIQLYDSFGRETVSATDAGGIYPRADRKPKYHHIDKGTPPLVNASRKAGEWQTLRLVFRAPRFADEGSKTKSAQFEIVELNGQVVQKNADVNWPTGANWTKDETPTGPVYLQGDHGPVAYRNVRVRAID